MEENFSEHVRDKYECTKTYHDGKWLMFDVDDTSLFHDIRMLLEIKKSPNRKLTMCGYCCDMCKAFVGNIKKKDERNILSDYWKKYYDLSIPAENIKCDGCRCKKPDAHRIVLSHNEANEINELDILNYYEYLGAFDNKSRLDRKS